MRQGEAIVLRRNLDRFVRRRGKCIPDELKQRVARWLMKQRALGVPLTELAAELGLSYATVLHWSKGNVRSGLVPVRVVAEADTRRTVRVISRGGFSIEGVTLEEAAELLRLLG